MIIDKPVKFTKHFRSRMKQFDLHWYDLLVELPLAEKSIPPKLPKKYSRDKVHSVRFGKRIYTYVETKDKFDGFIIYLFLTLYDQEIDL